MSAVLELDATGKTVSGDGVWLLAIGMGGMVGGVPIRWGIIGPGGIMPMWGCILPGMGLCAMPGGKPPYEGNPPYGP